MNQTCILVMGMHRSGTSALTGVLNILGAYLGKELLDANEANAKGYFENFELYKINEQLLDKADGSWDDAFFSESNIKKLDSDDIAMVEETIEKVFRNTNIFAIKDPRLVHLFPAYEKALSNLGVDIKVIIPYRNPVEVADSLNKRDSIPIEHGMLLWANHFLQTEKYSRKYDRVFVEFNDLLDQTKSVIEHVDSCLNTNFIEKYKTKKKSVASFLDHNLKHHNIAIDNLSSQAPEIIRKIVQLRHAYDDKGSYSVFDNLRSEFYGYIYLFGFLKEHIKSRDKNILSQQKIISQHEQTISGLVQTMSGHEQTISRQKQTISGHEQTMSGHEQTISGHEQTISQLEQTISGHEQTISGLVQTMSGLVQTMSGHEQTISRQKQTISGHEQTITRRKQITRQHEQTINQQKLEISEKNTEISNLNEEVVNVYMSNSMKITAPLRKTARLIYRLIRRLR